MGSIFSNVIGKITGRGREEEDDDWDASDEEFEDGDEDDNGTFTEKVVSMFSLGMGDAWKDAAQRGRRAVMAFTVKELSDARDVCDAMLDGKAVIVNLKHAEFAEAQRAIDFILGCAYSVNGSCMKITDRIFCIAPNGIILSDLEEDAAKAADSYKMAV